MRGPRTFEDRETIWVLGYPKSGNTWLCRLLGDVLDSPIAAGLRFPSNADEGFERPGPYVIRMRHHNLLKAPFPGDSRLVQIVRDPRDVLVSTKLYWQSKGWSEALARCENWAPNNEEWLERSPAVRYEDLLDNPLLWFQALLKDIGFLKGPVEIVPVIERQSWEARMKRVDEEGLPYGGPHQRRVLARGTAGNWKTDLNRNVGKAAHAHFWPMMQTLGYEDDPKWFEKLPEMVPV